MDIQTNIIFRLTKMGIVYGDNKTYKLISYLDLALNQQCKRSLKIEGHPLIQLWRTHFTALKDTRGVSTLPKNSNRGVQNVQCTCNWRTKNIGHWTLDPIEGLFSQIEGPLAQLKDYWRMKDKCPLKDIEGQSNLFTVLIRPQNSWCYTQCGLATPIPYFKLWSNFIHILSILSIDSTPAI